MRHAYASYGPAYRLTWESGERIVASQPWNERFRHYPLPYLDEVRFAKNVAWVLTPAIPTDLPTPRAFEEALGCVRRGLEADGGGAGGRLPRFRPAFGADGRAAAGARAAPGTETSGPRCVPRPRRRPPSRCPSPDPSTR